jgi:hypothetical protein
MVHPTFWREWGGHSEPEAKNLSYFQWLEDSSLRFAPFRMTPPVKKSDEPNLFICKIVLDKPGIRLYIRALFWVGF